jgi:integrase
MAQWAVAYVAEGDREAVREITDRHHAALAAYRDEVAALAYEIEQLLPKTPLDAEVWQQCRDGILSVVRYQVGKATEQPVADPAPAHTLDWAYDKWLRLKNRPGQTTDEAKRHLAEFTADAKIALLGEVKRRHLVEWRDRLSDAGELSPASVNQRLTLVSAILRAGWRDAEMPQPDLKAITVTNANDSERGAWTREEMLTAMRNLEPRSWAAWIFLIDLTTGVRLGEPMAAEISWYDPAGFIHVRSRSATKTRKLHLLPIIECLRGPLAAHVERRTDGYLFADAPRPNNPNLKISHEASKWFGRFFRRHEIHRVIHELRHTWIEEARHSAIPKDIWEIISGHSKLTVSDRYGGQKPDFLAAANEEVCKFLTDDQELKAAMLGLVN